MTYLGTIEDAPGECDYLFAASGSGDIDDLSQGTTTGNRCIERLAGLVSIDVDIYARLRSEGSSSARYILGPKTRIDTFCFGNPNNWALSARAD